MPKKDEVKKKIRKAYQENPLRFEDVLKMLEVKELPFLDTRELRGFAITALAEILQRHDQAWVKEHRVRLVEELEVIAEM